MVNIDIMINRKAQVTRNAVSGWAVVPRLGCLDIINGTR
jgi:hypothetical protein